MTDILEQARALICEIMECHFIPGHSTCHPCHCRETASAILALAEPKWEAMRVPTPAMIAAAWTVIDRFPHKRLGPGPGFKEAFTAMIDVAAKEWGALK